MITALEARMLSDLANHSYEIELESILKTIKKIAKNGGLNYICPIGNSQVIKILVDLGYGVFNAVTTSDDNIFTITWGVMEETKSNV